MDLNLYAAILPEIIREKFSYGETELEKLTFGQISILYTIYDLELEKENVVSNVARKLGRSLSTVSKNLKVLEKSGYIQRESKIEDRRNVYVTISEERKEVVDSMYQEVKGYFVRIIEMFDSQELKVLEKIESKLKEF